MDLALNNVQGLQTNKQDIYVMHSISFQTFFVQAFKIVVDT